MPRHQRHRLARSRLEEQQRFPQGEAWRGYTIGLLAAERLQGCFPAFYQTHVAASVVTPRRLLGVVQAFLSLAQQHVELLLAEDLETNPANPLAVLHPRIDDEDALAIIAEYAGRDVSEIWPLVYGLDDDEEALFGYGDHPPLLAVVCWALAEQTSWSNGYVNVERLITNLQRQIYQRRVHPETLRRLAELPRLAPDTSMDLVCDRLNQSELFYDANLGLIVRYCFHATGNQFADLSYNLVAQMERSNLDWLEEDLAALGQLQREAEAIADAYRDLNARMIADPAGLEELLARVIAAAASGCTPATTVIENETA